MNGEFTLPPGVADPQTATNTAAISALQTGKADKYRAYRAHTGTSDTAVLADGGNVVTSNNAAAVTQTIPSNAAVPYPVDTIIEFIQLGAGQMTFTVTTDTLLPIPGGVAKSLGQGASVFAKKVATTTWQLTGALAVS